MTFFADLPKLIYNLDVDNRRLVTNLLVSVRRRHSNAVSKLAILDSYPVIDGDTPEIVAHKLYGHTQWWWVVLLVADAVKPSHWPKGTAALDAYVEAIHGSKGDALGFWVDESGLPVADRVRTSFQDETGATIDWHDNGEGLGALSNGVIQARGTFVTFRQKTLKDNEALRRIVVIAPKFLSDFVDDYRRQVSSRLPDGAIA